MTIDAEVIKRHIVEWRKRATSEDFVHLQREHFEGAFAALEALLAEANLTRPTTLDLAELEAEVVAKRHLYSPGEADRVLALIAAAKERDELRKELQARTEAHAPSSIS